MTDEQIKAMKYGFYLGVSQPWTPESIKAILDHNPVPTVDPSIAALSEVQTRIEVSLVTLASLVAQLDASVADIDDRLGHMERVAERMERTLAALQTAQ